MTRPIPLDIEQLARDYRDLAATYTKAGETSQAARFHRLAAQLQAIIGDGYSLKPIKSINLFPPEPAPRPERAPKRPRKAFPLNIAT